MVESNNTAGKEIFGAQPLLRDILAESTFKPGRLIPCNVNSLNLGVFQEEARQLANNCFLDVDNKDLGKLVYVTGKKKVLVPLCFFQGHARGELAMLGITSQVSKEIAEKEKLNEPYLAMTIHSQGNTDLSFSATDLYLLMLNDSNPGASVASFAVGRTKNMLFFRGQNTPQLDSGEADKKARLWLWQLEERIGQFIKPGMSREERLSIIDKAERALLRQICAKYDLQFFSGDTNDAIVTKQTP